MADKTPNLGLPLITENMTANVPRDMNALAQAIDESVGDINLEDIKDYVDDKPWQKHKLTEDNGLAKLLVTADLNTLTATGNYYVGTATNGPGENTNYYVEVIVGQAVHILLQRATSFFGNQVYTRQRSGTTSWTPWVLQTPQPNVWGAL